MQHLKILTGLLVSILTSPAIAVPVYWDMSFLDGEGAQVGSASFYYDDETTDKLWTVPNRTDTNLPDSNDLYSKIESFEGSIDGVGEINEGPANIYWFDDNTGIAAGSTGYGRYISGGNQWLFDRYQPYPDRNEYIFGYRFAIQFYDNETQTLPFYDGNTATGGSWFKDYVLGEGAESATETGTWIASLRSSSIPAVPVPATLPLFGLGLAGLMWLSSRQRSHKSRNLNIA